MLIRTTLALLSVAACGYASEPDITDERDSNMICDDLCDPTDLELHATLSGANQYAYSLFPDAVMRGQSCIDLEPGTECLVTYATTRSPCGPVTVDCMNFPIHGRNRVQCDWSVGGCD